MIEVSFVDTILTGEPLGSKRFVTQLEERVDRVLARRRPGPKAKEEKS